MKSVLSLFSLWSSSSIISCLATPLPAIVDSHVAINRIFETFKKFVDDMPKNVTAQQRALLTESTGPFTITQKSATSVQRAAVIQMRREEFLYGDSLGGGPSYPSGPLGLARNALDWLQLQTELVPQMGNAVDDAYAAAQGFWKYGGLRTMKDYVNLYDGEWKKVLPKGPNVGFQNNYTQDLLFSMGRLSYNPYAVRRLDPSSGGALNFQVDDGTAIALSGMTLSQLYKAGRLFYADYRNQKDFPRNQGAYAAAADAYFFIHPKSGDFLPLAVRTNYGANLIYTPRDAPDDWLLGKMIFNVNDFWFNQFNHYATTHEVVHIAYMAAMRTMSNDHPVLSILNRLMYQIFSFPPVAKTLLFTAGAVVDRVFPYPGPSAQAFCDLRYFKEGVGRFQANYFRNELRSRGMIDSKVGPPLKHFPFYEDATVIQNEQHKFFTSFVDSYYSSDAVVKADTELQAWADEANGPAKAQDFPKTFTKATLIDTLTHFAHLVTTTHHALNTNGWLESSSVLPFEPPALYKELPTTKGIKNPADWLPPLTKVLESMAFGAFFARPLMVGTNRTLIHMFDDDDMLSQMNPQVTEAANKFKAAMIDRTAVFGARQFDRNGLSQGMPFIWNALDPSRMPYSVTI